MKKIRTIIITLILGCYLVMLSPLNGFFNKPELFLGLPMFMTVLLLDAIILSVLMIVLYNIENRQKDNKN